MENNQITLLNPEFSEVRTDILEFLNSIDEWENEILFDGNGFYSLDAKQASEKFKEYSSELELFANKLINELKLNSENFRDILIGIKNQKIKFIQNEMQTYIQNKMKNYETDVNEKTIMLTINRAVLHKNNPEIVEMSKQNGLSAVNLLNAQGGRNDLSVAESKYKSDFVSAVINSFIEDKDINAFYYFEKYKDELSDYERTKLETVVNELKVNIIAYNYAKELFSYSLPDEERDKEIKAINDEKTEKLVSLYLSDFERDKKKSSEEEEKARNIVNTDEIVSMLENGNDNAYLYIDYSLPESTVKFKKEYIKLIKKNGEILTDSKKFLELTALFVSNFEDFRKKDISEYVISLSKKDFSLLRELQTLKDDEYIILKSDFYNIFHIFSENEIEDDDLKREICLLYLHLLENYKNSDGKSADITVRNNIISEIQKRYIK